MATGNKAAKPKRATARRGRATASIKKPKRRARKTQPAVTKPKRRRRTTDPLPPKPAFKPGDLVLFATMPAWVATLPKESQAVYAHCFGRNYMIEEITPDGMLVLDVSADVDHLFGGFMNDIRIEPSCAVAVPTQLS